MTLYLIYAIFQKCQSSNFWLRVRYLFTKEKSMVERFFWEDESSYEMMYRLLASGEAIVGDSDTVLGLYASVCAKGRARLDSIKERSEKPYLILVARKDKALCFIEKPVSDLVQKIMDACWPGPVTLICRARADLPDYAKHAQGTVALRVPLHKGLQAILSECEGLFSTSANKTGKPVPAFLHDVGSEILDRVAGCVLNKEEGGSSVTSSTILDCTGEQIKLIREGAYPVALLEERSGVHII